MNREVVFTLLAEQDLDRIDDFMARENPAAARAFIVRVDHQREFLAQFPESGRLRPELGPGVRTLAKPEKTVIAYRIDGPTICILRVFYRGQNIEDQMRRDAGDE